MPAEGSHKSFQPKPPPPAKPRPGDQDNGPPDPATPAEPAPQPGGRNQEREWRGQKRSNETHASVIDPDGRLARKSNGQANILAYAGHVLIENRNGLVSEGGAARWAPTRVMTRRRLSASCAAWVSHRVLRPTRRRPLFSSLLEHRPIDRVRSTGKDAR